MKKSLIATTALLLSTGIFGCSKGVEDIYSFKYHGQNAVIKYENIRFAPDKYWIEIEGKEKIFNGTITTDDNKLIEIGITGLNRFSIKDNKF